MTKPKGVTVKRERITPQKAEEMIEGQRVNRRLNESRIAALAADMLAETWQDNGETIKLDKAGALLDGQHRLTAISRSQRTQHLLVARNIPHTAIITIDSGTSRTMANHLEILGISKAGTTLAGALRFLWAHEKGGVLRTRVPPTNQQLHELYSLNPGLKDSLEYVMAGRWKKVSLSPALATFLHFVFAQKDADQAAVFFENLHDGDGLHKGDIVYMLREKLLENAVSPTKATTAYIAALVIKSWNFARRGNAPKRLLFGMRESFPEIL
jgi:hypothetical protein